MGESRSVVTEGAKREVRILAEEEEHFERGRPASIGPPNECMSDGIWY